MEKMTCLKDVGLKIEITSLNFIFIWTEYPADVNMESYEQNDMPKRR